MAAGGHFGSPIWANDNRILPLCVINGYAKYEVMIGEFVTQLEKPQVFWSFWYKMAARGHFVFPIDAKNHI